MPWEGLMALTEAYVAGPKTPAVREITLGDLLRARRTRADRIALIAGVPDPAMRRTWTYAQFYAAGAAHGARAAHAIQARRTIRRLGPISRMDHAGIRRGSRRARHGHRQSGLPRQRGRIRAEAVAFGRHVRRQFVPRESDARHSSRGRAAARNCGRSCASTTGRRSIAAGDDKSITLPDAKPSDAA